MSILKRVRFPMRRTHLREVTTKACEQMLIKKP